MGVGSPECLLLFRKLPSDTSTAYADEPVVKNKQAMALCPACKKESVFAYWDRHDNSADVLQCPECGACPHSGSVVITYAEDCQEIQVKGGYSRGRWQIDARAKWNSSGDRLMTPEEVAAFPVDMICRMFSARMADSVYDFNQHISIAEAMERKRKLPATFETLRVPARTEWVWDDVNRMHTLNSQQTQKRERNHICPLQIDIVDRVIDRWSNPGDLVLDPFGGLMTVPSRAIIKGRRGYGIELNSEYFRCGVGYIKEAVLKKAGPTLFDFLKEEEGA